MLEGVLAGAGPRAKRALIPGLLILAVQGAAADPPPLLWEQPLGAPSFGSAALGDIDEDGKPEIVFGAYFGDGRVHALNAEDGSLAWDLDVGGGPLDASAAIADVDQDGHLEVLVAASWGIQFCLNGAGEMLWRFPPTGYVPPIDSPPAVADVDGDGKPEVVFGAWNGMVYALNGEDGSLLWEQGLGETDYIQSQPAVLDVDGDGQLEIVVASFSDAATVFALRGDDGSVLWDVPTGDLMYHGPSFADIDEDGRPELAISCYDGSLYVLNAEDGSELWTRAAGRILYSPVALADLDRDGHLELVTSGDDLFVFSHEGTLQWTYPVGRSIFRGASVADVDGDGWLDLAFGSSDHVLRVVRGVDGSDIWTWDLGGDNEIDHAPTLADLDGDGDLDLFFVAGWWEDPANHGQAYAVDVGEGTGRGWPMFAHDLRHSGCFELSRAVLHRSTVASFAPGWRSASLPLRSNNDQAQPPFPLEVPLPGSALDELPTEAPLTLYRLLAENDTPTEATLRLRKVGTGVELSF